MAWQKITYILFCFSILPNLVDMKGCKKGPSLTGVKEDDDQCKRLGYGYACVDEHTCENLRCAYQGIFNLDAIGALWSCEETGLQASEGGSCGLGFHCQSGKCVEIPGWEKPTYKHPSHLKKEQHSSESTDSKPDDC